MMRTQTVTGGGGCRLHVEETGKREGRPILFIHAFSQCRLSWTRQLHSDLEDDFRLVALDLRAPVLVWRVEHRQRGARELELGRRLAMREDAGPPVEDVEIGECSPPLRVGLEADESLPFAKPFDDPAGQPPKFRRLYAHVEGGANVEPHRQAVQLRHDGVFEARAHELLAVDMNGGAPAPGSAGARTEGTTS